MKRHKVELVWGEDQEHGGFGWIPKLNPSFNAMRGFGVAHDVMEHTDLISGSLEEEMLAFGAMLYIRGEGGWWWDSMNSSIASNMRGDIAQFSRDVFYQKDYGCVLGKPKRTLRIDHEWDIEEIVRQAWRALRDEFEYEAEDWRAFQHYNPDYRKRLAGWIRRGYQECVRRYKGHKAYHLCDVFREITQKVDSYKYVEQGEELHITLEISEREVVPKFNLLRLDDLYPYDEEAY
jgi:hypothetical protein